MNGGPEPWLRGPLPGIPAPLQPAAHAFVMALEDVEHAVAELTHDAAAHAGYRRRPASPAARSVDRSRR